MRDIIEGRLCNSLSSSFFWLTCLFLSFIHYDLCLSVYLQDTMFHFQDMLFSWFEVIKVSNRWVTLFLHLSRASCIIQHKTFHFLFLFVYYLIYLIFMSTVWYVWELGVYFFWIQKRVPLFHACQYTLLISYIFVSYYTRNERVRNIKNI